MKENNINKNAHPQEDKIMNKGEQLWNQYKLLWDNMQDSNKLNYQIMGGIITASVAILTIGFNGLANEKDPIIIGLIFLGVFMITIPGQKLLKGNRGHIWRLSTYILTFLEPHFEYLKWETNVNELSKRPNKVKANDKKSYS
ncbi:MAG: hypothetical protein ICV68_18355, partial [Pyrinomonadaceae bacterium]|nr:hypothetical protein [Pyrinomonadaceae bacterium]